MFVAPGKTYILNRFNRTGNESPLQRNSDVADVKEYFLYPSFSLHFSDLDFSFSPTTSYFLPHECVVCSVDCLSSAVLTLNLILSLSH